VGAGFPPESREMYVWDNLLVKKFNFLKNNIAIKGSSNYTIFMRSANAIISKKYDVIVTQWTALNRLWLSPGPECHFFVNDQKFPDFRYRDVYISANEKSMLTKLFLLLNHDYQNIFELIDYNKILSQLATVNNVKLIHVNGLVPWQDDLITNIDPNELNSTLTEYTKNILDVSNRDDNEIIDYVTKLQNKFAELDQDKWVNLFESFLNNTVDIGPEGHHPGIKSNQWMADQVANYIIEKQII